MTAQAWTDDELFQVLEKYQYFCVYCRQDFLKDPAALTDAGFERLQGGQERNISHLLLACSRCRNMDPIALVEDASAIVQDPHKMRDFTVRWKFYEMRQRFRGV